MSTDGTTLLRDISPGIRSLVHNDIHDIEIDLTILMNSNLASYAREFKELLSDIIDIRDADITLNNELSAGVIRNARRDNQDAINQLNNQLRQPDADVDRIRDEIREIEIDMANQLESSVSKRLQDAEDINRTALLNILRLRVQLASMIHDPSSVTESYDINDRSSYFTLPIYNTMVEVVGEEVADNIVSIITNLINDNHIYSLRLFTNRILYNLNNRDELLMDYEELLHRSEATDKVSIGIREYGFDNYDRLILAIEDKITGRYSPNYSKNIDTINRLMYDLGLLHSLGYDITSYITELQHVVAEKPNLILSRTKDISDEVRQIVNNYHISKTPLNLVRRGILSY